MYLNKTVGTVIFVSFSESKWNRITKMILTFNAFTIKYNAFTMCQAQLEVLQLCSTPIIILRRKYLMSKLTQGEALCFRIIKSMTDQKWKHWQFDMIL